MIDSGVGPLTGSILIAWAEDRLAGVQGTRYKPNDEPTRKVKPDERDDIAKVIKRLMVKSVEAAGVNGFLTALGGFIVVGSPGGSPVDMGPPTLS